MPETIVITTQVLETAVRLRDAFQEEDFEVELLTTTERLANVAEPALLVLTGDLTEPRSRHLAREAYQSGRVPIIAIADEPRAVANDAASIGIAEVFARSAPIDDVVLIGGQALGGPMIGWLAENIGAQPSMVIAGGVPVLAAGGIAVVLARRGQLTVRFRWTSAHDERRRLVAIVPKVS